MVAKGGVFRKEIAVILLSYLVDEEIKYPIKIKKMLKETAVKKSGDVRKTIEEMSILGFIDMNIESKTKFEMRYIYGVTKKGTDFLIDSVPVNKTFWTLPFWEKIAFIANTITIGDFFLQQI